MPVRTCLRLASVLAVLLQGALADSATVEEVVKSLRALSPPQRKSALEEGARKEGETVWYTSMSLTDFPKITGAFEKTAPFVKVRVNRLSQSSIMPKIDTETRAGHYAVDNRRFGADGNVGIETTGLFSGLSFT
jgi:ABC-type glycerol-3-phosphate transport system substrate-binding protein